VCTVKSALLAIKQIRFVFLGHPQSCLQLNSIIEYQTDSTAQPRQCPEPCILDEILLEKPDKKSCNWQVLNGHGKQIRIEKRLPKVTGHIEGWTKNLSVAEVLPF